jgi:hypothetical protein
MSVRSSFGVFLCFGMLLPALVTAEWIEGEGVGTILANDVAQARDEAIIDARVRVLEKAVGVLVDAEALVQNELLLAATVRNTTSGLIRSYDVIEEQTSPEGMYRVRIRADVVEAEELEETIRNDLTSNLTLVVQIDEEMADEPVDDPLVESEVVEALVNGGYDVRDREQVRQLRERDSDLARIGGDEEEAQIIGLRFLSNLIIKGTSRTSVHENKTAYAPDVSLTSAHARVTCRMIEVESGRIVAHKQLRRVKAFGQDGFDASEKALEDAAPQMASLILSWMNSEYLMSKMQTVIVEGNGLPDLASFRKLTHLLEKLRWVESVEPSSFDQGSGTIALRYPEKLVYLATRIDRDPSFRLVMLDARRIVVSPE